MVKVTVWRDEAGHIVACAADGHAGAGKKGRDIVCAAVSALTETALLGLDRHAGAPLTYEVREGRLSFKLSARPDEKTDAILETMCLGLSEIAGKYADNLKLQQCGGE
jgi:uncharacterized protein YsxB (DUF464 family)